MGRMKAKLMDMMENPEHYDLEGIDGSDEYELMLPKGMKTKDLWDRLERQSEPEEDELNFDLD